MKVSAENKALHDAIVVRNYLMMLWLRVFGWRLRNMIECRIGTSELNGNIFRGGIMRGIALPPWANRNEEYWQYVFAPEENKEGHWPKGFVPRILITILERYEVEYRKTLLGNGKSNVLFLTDHGHPFTRRSFEAWLSSLSMRYVAEHITPHAVRRSLGSNLTAGGMTLMQTSRVLWQIDLTTTAEYCICFDESDGSVCLDEFFGDPSLGESKEPDPPKPTVGRRSMDGISDLLRQKEGELQQIQVEVEALRLAMCQIAEEGEHTGSQGRTLALTGTGLNQRVEEINAAVPSPRRFQ